MRAATGYVRACVRACVCVYVYVYVSKCALAWRVGRFASRVAAALAWRLRAAFACGKSVHMQGTIEGIWLARLCGG